jgi:bacteriorhodopsin
MNTMDRIMNYLFTLFLMSVVVWLIYLCCWKVTEIQHRLEMNIIVVQSLQTRIDELEKK